MSNDLVELGRQVLREYTRPMGRGGRPLTNIEGLALIHLAMVEKLERIAAQGCCGGPRDADGQCQGVGLCPLVRKALELIGERTR